jgi:hypothetical protein
MRCTHDLSVQHFYPTIRVNHRASGRPLTIGLQVWPHHFGWLLNWQVVNPFSAAHAEPRGFAIELGIAEIAWPSWFHLVLSQIVNQSGYGSLFP